MASEDKTGVYIPPLETPRVDRVHLNKRRYWSRRPKPSTEANRIM